MTDWKNFVGRHLAGLNLSLESREDVIAELASHLEETYVDARSRGYDEAAAIKLTSQQAGLEAFEDGESSPQQSVAQDRRRVP